MRGRSLLGHGTAGDRALDAIVGAARDQGWALLYSFGLPHAGLIKLQSPRSDLYSYKEGHVAILITPLFSS
jgi:hypothetical protein